MISKIAYCARIKCFLNPSKLPFHAHMTHKRDKMPVVIFFLRLCFCFRPYFGMRRKKITDESLQIMILVMDLIKIDDSSISRSFVGHRKM